MALIIECTCLVGCHWRHPWCGHVGGFSRRASVAVSVPATCYVSPRLSPAVKHCAARISVAPSWDVHIQRRCSGHDLVQPPPARHRLLYSGEMRPDRATGDLAIRLSRERSTAITSVPRAPGRSGQLKSLAVPVSMNWLFPRLSLWSGKSAGHQQISITLAAVTMLAARCQS